MFKYFKYDLKAGIVVFLVALPLCLGIALGQKVDLFSGIISGIIGGIVVTTISGSKFSVSGPAAGLSAIVISSMETLKPSLKEIGIDQEMLAVNAEKLGISIESYMTQVEGLRYMAAFEVFLVALVIAGVFQIILGTIKAGIIGYYFPSSVIRGMLAGIGIYLVVKQIPHFFGDDKDPEGDFQFIQSDGENSFSEIINMVNMIIPGAAIIGLVSIAILILWNRPFIKKNKILSFVPGPLLVVVIGIGINFFLQKNQTHLAVQPEHLVQLPDISSWDQLKASLHFPEFKHINNPKVWEIGFILAIVASLETLLGLDAVDKLDPEHNVSPTNRELIAQGIGNLSCGLIGGIPMTSVIVRSSANVSSGAKTKLSAIIHGILLAVAVFLIPGVLKLIPNSALAAILIVTGYKLAKPSLFVKTFKSGWDQFLPFIITLVVMLVTDLLKGVGVGIFVGIIFILRQNFKNPYKLVTDTIDGVPHFFMKLSQSVTFINKGKIIQVLHTIPNGSKVYIDGGRSTFIDKDVLEIITEFKESAKMKNIDVVLEDIQEVELITAH